MLNSPMLLPIFEYQDQEYRIVAKSGSQRMFYPNMLGLMPTPYESFQGKGYQTYYALVSNKQLVVSAFWLSLAELDEAGYFKAPRVGPAINGVYPNIGSRYGLKDVNRLNHCDNWYTNINLEMDYTGGLLLVNEFVQDWPDINFPVIEDHALKYKTVLELTFERGSLLEVSDRSKQIADIRKNIPLLEIEAKASGCKLEEKLNTLVQESCLHFYLTFNNLMLRIRKGKLGKNKPLFCFNEVDVQNWIVEAQLD